MDRFLLKKMLDWKLKAKRKPLILQGARQVGKTFLIKEFGKKHYRNTIYINLEQEKWKNIFNNAGLEANKIIKGLEIEFETNIEPQNTLLVFDEIQECPQALLSLKYFCEDLPDYQIIAAGSLLGVALSHKKQSFPVGKVSFLQLNPMSFFEFLVALGKEKLYELAVSNDFKSISMFREKFEEMLKLYFFIGGMPEAVQTFLDTENFVKVRETQKELIKTYELDFSKHISPVSVPKVRNIWNSVHEQLARENKKFTYSKIDTGEMSAARSSTYEEALCWLENSRLVYKVKQASRPQTPLGYYGNGAFKLYLHDIGLLGTQSELSEKSLFEPNTELFSHFRGALAEQFVLQELRAFDESNIFYWNTENGSAEIEFLLQLDSNIIPLEVKAGLRTQAKSLFSYVSKYNPEFAIKSSLKNFGVTNKIHSIPLYLITRWKEFLLPFLKVKATAF